MILSVVTIQSKWRCHATRKSYTIMLHDIIRIQSLYRGTQVRTLLKLKSEQDWQRVCVIRLQSLVRMYLSRKIMENDNLSAIVIQKYYRCYKHSSNFRKLQPTTILIQKSIREMFSRNLLQNKHNAAIKLQKI
mmetsp:Transcript_27415/g.26275  ORF Transcript_27415/g.26275 Transcript_27415/m.26275 type:complete len:133 (+) Transcript_27415:149-547(+)